MNKLLLLGLIVIIGIALFWGGSFYWQNLRGLSPAIKGPVANISKLLEESEEIRENLKEYNDQIKEQLDDGEAATEYYQQGPLALPVSFKINTFAQGLGKVRVLIHAPNGGLLASLPNEGRVVRIVDTDNDDKSDQTDTVVSGLNQPHGLVTKCANKQECLLYVAETNQVSLYDYNLVTSLASQPRKIIDLPAGGNHWTRTIIIALIDGQEKLLISVGSSCNVCEEEDWRRAKILVANLDGSNLQEFAKGLRNSVFMASHPVTGEVWATENGRDLIGDDLPPEEINIIKKDNDYGWPWCYGNKIHDSQFDKRQYIVDPCQSTTLPQIEFQAHSAPLGLAFIPEEGWPENMWYDLLVAYHGSWNRTEPTGYKVVRFKLDNQGNYLGQEDFISGWLQDDGRSLGRPVDILLEPGGVMYLSDDTAGVIYKIIEN